MFRTRTFLILTALLGSLTLGESFSSASQTVDCLTELTASLQDNSPPHTVRATFRLGETFARISEYSSAQTMELFRPRGFTKTLSRNGHRLEVGGAQRPFCSDCIQVDKHRRLADTRPDLLDDPKELEQYLAEAQVSREEFFQPWAAASRESIGLKPGGGLVANAHSMPIKADSVDFIFSKNFPWFGEMRPEKLKLIEDTLKEFERVMSPHGIAVLVVDRFGPEVFSEHIRIARQLGFDVSFTKTNALQLFVEGKVLKESPMGGLILTKKPRR